MYQIYFLTVVVNLFVGFLVADSFFRKKNETCGAVLDLFSSANSKLVISLISLVTGVIALFKPGDIFFIGDLLPAVGAIMGGLIIGSEALRAKSDEPPAFVNFISDLGEKIAVYIGLGMMAAGIMHALIPNAVIL